MLRHKVQSSFKYTDLTPERNVGQIDKCEPAGPVTQGPLKGDKKLSSIDYFHEIFGFQKHDLFSWDRFVRLLCRPSDPASLGTLRVFFGFLMALDIVQERGLAAADSWWGSDEECRFPLFNFLHPLPLQWMYIVYLVMLSGTLGILLGFKMRLSSSIYLATYWYIFFLDKTAWNNHSYLFGVLAFLLAISDANRYWSLDGLLNPDINNAHIPLWNYVLIRAQIFIVYFIAGLKKLDTDWISGYSMQSLSHHWMFYPFKLLLTESQIDLYVVHLGGFFIDISMGFLLFFDKTRLFGLLISSSFHLMNSQLFSIGMFPWAMLTMQLVFCNMSWPRKYFKTIHPSLRLFTPEETEFHSSSSCIYPKNCVKSETLCSSFETAYSEKAPPTSPALKHKLASVFTITFIAWQFFLPYSHGVTKGYNNWTNGLYGYSWDMMVHSWSVQHIRITYYDKDTGQSGYLHPMVWTGGNRRWSSHGDMIKQYAHCIADNLKSYNISNVAVYIDIWRSLNYRFQQRMVDPRVDMITAEWNPFSQPSWLMPLMVDLSDWRAKLDHIQTSLNSITHTNVVFVADFPELNGPPNEPSLPEVILSASAVNEGASTSSSTTSTSSPHSTPRFCKKLELSASSVQEASTPNNTVSRTIVDMSEIRNLVSQLACPECYGKLSAEINNQAKRGLVQHIKVNCCVCNKTIASTYTSSVDEHNSFSVNKVAVLLSLLSGMGPYKFNYFAQNMDMLGLHQKTFNTIAKKIYLQTPELAKLIFDHAAKLARSVNCAQSNQPYHEYIMDIGVSFDGSWHTRGHSSKIGIGCVVEILTGLVIDAHVLSKYCQTCATTGSWYQKEAPGNFSKWKEEHVKQGCDINVEGMFLENYIQPDFGNTTITVLAGEVIVEFLDAKKNITVGPDQSIQVAASTFHNVHTISETPSCYLYTFVNTTEVSFMKSYTQFEEDYNKSRSLNETLQKYQQDPNLVQYQQMLESMQAEKNEVLQSVWQRFKSFLRLKYNLFRRSIRLSTGAVYCLATGSSFSEFLNATYQWEASTTLGK